MVKLPLKAPTQSTTFHCYRRQDISIIRVCLQDQITDFQLWYNHPSLFAQAYVINPVDMSRRTSEAMCQAKSRTDEILIARVDIRSQCDTHHYYTREAIQNFPIVGKR